MPKHRRFLLLAGLALAQITPASAAWLPLGSPVQPILELRLDPSRPNLLYAGTSAGPGAFFYLWRSADAGATWSNVQAGPGQILQALAIDPEDPRVIWVWTIGNELWRSDDAGATWEEHPTPIDPFQGATYQLLVDPHHPETLYRVDLENVQPAVAVSRDGGATFTQGAPLSKSLTNRQPVVVDRRSGALLAFVAEGLRASTNGGQSWSLRGQFHNAGFTQGALAPSDSRTLYGIPTNVNQCLVRSDDGGAHWQALAVPPRLPAHSTCDAVAVDPLNARHVWVAAQTVANGHAQHLLFESSNGGARWSNPVAEPTAGVVAAGGERIYTSSSATPGLFVSANGGRTWTDAAHGIIAGEVREGLVAQRLPGGARRLVVAVNTPQGGPPNDIYRSDGGPSWVKVPIPPEQTIADASGSIVLAGNANGVLRSSDSGITWSAVPSAPPGVLAFLPSVNQPSYTALTAAEDAGPAGRSIALWTSDDAGATWHRGDSGLAGDCARITARGILVCPNYSAYLEDPFFPNRRWLAYDFPYTISQPTLFISTDGGASWQAETSSLPRTLALAALPSVPNHLLAGTDGGLFESPNGGKDWFPWGNLPAGAIVRQLVWDPLSSSWYAATHANGIYRSLDDGAHWTLLAGAPDHDDPTIAVDPRRPTALLAGFEGQGLWRWTP